MEIIISPSSSTNALNHEVIVPLGIYGEAWKITIHKKDHRTINDVNIINKET